MDEVEDNSIALVVTSPPYNVGQEYEEKLSLKEYLYFLSDVWQKVQKKLIPGGRLAINIANTGRNPYISLSSLITQQLNQLGMVQEGEIIWQKPLASKNSFCAFGSWRMPSNPMLRDTHEYILVFRKDKRRRDISKIPEDIKNKSRLSKEEFLELHNATWHMNTASKKGHPCPFPLELPRRLIKFYTFEDWDWVMDPFLGSGTTTLASKELNRSFIGYETSPKYVQIAKKRVNIST